MSWFGLIWFQIATGMALQRFSSVSFCRIPHQPNAPTCGKLSHIELGEFLRDQTGPEQQALLRLIGTLVEVPPFA
jgi:hypothetical protein